MRTWKDPSSLAKAVIIWLYIWLVAQTLFGISSVVKIVASSGELSDAPVNASSNLALSDTINGAAALIYLPIHLFTAFLVLKWIFRTNSNAWAAGRDMTVSPGWSVGFFFVPFATWWKPFQGVRETWQVSHQPDDPQSVDVPNVLRWWWACWLVASISDNLSFRLSFGATTVGAERIAVSFDVASAIVGVPLALLLIKVVRELTYAQMGTLRSDLEEIFALGAERIHCRECRSTRQCRADRDTVSIRR
jgi:hypothetical protein